MVWQPTTRLQISGNRFLRRRLECALVGVDPCTGTEWLRAATRPLTIGVVVAAVALAGCLVLALLRPQPDLGSAPIVMERQSGALYVRLGATLHPVPNLASARLIAKTNVDPQPITATALGRSTLGPQLGIAGAPAYLGAPLGDGESPWTVCDSRDRTTVVVGATPLSGILSGGQTLFVTPSSGGSSYLLFDDRRAVIDPDDAAAVRAAGLDGQTPVPVSATLLNLIPEVPPIAAPPIPDAGKPGPGALRSFPVGSVLRVGRGSGDEYYVVLTGGVQRVGQLAAELLRFADSRGAHNAISVAPDIIRAAKSVTTLPLSDFPDQSRPVPIADNATVCARWAYTGSEHAALSFSVGEPPIPALRSAVALAQNDGRGPAVDAFFLPPGRTAVVRAAGASGVDARVGTRYLVGDTGVRYAVHDDDAAHDLGLPDAVTAAPWSALRQLPAGPELSRLNASVAQDVPAVGSGSP